MKDYEAYYSSGFYDERYPKPNLRTLTLINRILTKIQYTKTGPLKILDFGAGSGRYSIPLLITHPTARIVALDTSTSARNLLLKRAIECGVNNRLDVLSKLEECDQDGFDCILMIFGVLSHITSSNQRHNLLHSFVVRLASNGSLICTVPNIYRRFPLHVARNIVTNRSFKNAGQISYTRNNGSQNLSLQYQLYSPSSLMHELQNSGFNCVTIAPESILPEKLITTSKAFSSLDCLMSCFLPSVIGYGISAIVRKEK